MLRIVIGVMLRLCGGGLVLCAVPALAAEVHVLCSNGVHAAMRELAPEFRQATGHVLAIDYESAAILLGRIKAGESPDVAVLTSRGIDELSELGRISKADGAGRVDLARYGVGIAVREGSPLPDIRTVEALRRTLLAVPSIAYTTTGASGSYFAGLLERLGIATEVRAKAKLLRSGSTGELVARGEAEMAVQQVPELRAVPGIVVVGPLPPSVQNFTVFSGAVLRTARDAEAAKAFLHFLASPGAVRVFASKGMPPD